MNTLKLIFVLTISSSLLSCSNSTKKNTARTESIPADTIQTIRKLPDHHDSVIVIKEFEDNEKPMSGKAEVAAQKRVVPKPAEQVKSQVKVYTIHKPAITQNHNSKVITRLKPPISGIKRAIPPPAPPARAVVIQPQQTAEAQQEKVSPADTATVSAENPASEPAHSAKPAITVPKKKSARLAYNYSSEMKRNVSEDINVYVSVVNSESYVKDTLMKIVDQQKNPKTRKTNADSIVTANILFYKRIKVELIDPDAAFKIDSVYGKAWQDVDSTGDNRWRWSVKPLTDQPNAKLVIKVVAKTPAGAIEDIDDRTFFIKVEMTGPFQMFRTWWIYLQDHPELFLTVIIIPLIAFFGKRYFDRKSKEQKP